jgi:Protein of unknown function (DUF3302)
MKISIRFIGRSAWWSCLAAAWCLAATPAYAASDAVADVMSWIVIILVPIGAIWVFWLVHVLPEKIAEKRHHPQAQAIKTLCLLSLVFGGLLWPIAWLWAYTRPVLHKMAYGVDRVDPHADEHAVSAQSVEHDTTAEAFERHAAAAEARDTPIVRNDKLRAGERAP